MYDILVRIIVATALLEVGLSASKIETCSSRTCWIGVQRAGNTVLRIDWKPISFFPKEARRFEKDP